MYKRICYEIFIAILSLISCAIILVQLTLEPSNNIAYILDISDNIIWVIFVIDYVVRFIFSESKLKFIKNNKIDLISIIPFNAIFQSLRMFRIFKVLKLAKIAKLARFAVLICKFKNRADKFLKTNNFQYILIITVVTVFLGAFGISITENKSFADSLWWSFVTITTVGYGDISPATNTGRIIASILMLVGIGFVGMLTGTIATYFLTNKKKSKSYRDEVIETIQEKLNDFESLSKEDLEDMHKTLLSFVEQD
ncbi:potassium channel family protein [Inconstantimicrobium mannanitabidum]|uniref:Potassium channel protein n=1 Tax=Inconstantimicrobium mannanitabidum TaxID=1604901 RepID=A0ACB5RA05_9CLOT|nr:potassium channel family protein [Clostridium sp. TW13]GKX66018.1 potassium channel protein [Clostridium sp. TW13]